MLSILKDAIKFKKLLHNARKLLERASQCLECYKMLKGQKDLKKVSGLGILTKNSKKANKMLEI